MNRLIVLAVIVVVLAGPFCFFCTQKKLQPTEMIAAVLQHQLDSFRNACEGLREAVSEARNPNMQTRSQQLFLRARAAYKKMEWATEYFLPATARSVNGPPVQEVELSGMVIRPAGLQVIEGLLFPRFDTANQKQILQQLDIIRRATTQYATYFKNIDILDWQVFDATKLEVFRIETMGITGFDDPLTLLCINESAVALAGVQQVLSTFISGDQVKPTLRACAAAIQYLQQPSDFNSFDRARFITGYANPVTQQITLLEKRSNVTVTRYNRLLNQDAATLFDTGAYNVNAYAPDQSAFLTREKVILGAKLFADPLLSQNGLRSCRSCHQPEKAFTDGLLKNTVLGDSILLARNTPTLINAALQPSQFYDGRVRTLEDQSNTVVQNEQEMHGSLAVSVQRLWQDPAYRELFAAAFPKKNRLSIDTLEVMNALGSYVRSLTRLNSRFDEYMRGNKTAMTRMEVKGFNIFMGKAKCATCHYLPLFNGTPPPRYMKMETEVIGVPASTTAHIIDADPGRYQVIQNKSFLHAFKTPTLRNASLTAPYMHNGVYTTLQQVMDFYNRGGGQGMGMPVSNQTLSPEHLELTDDEQAAVVVFIRSLDSRRE